jgi:hypothetical protein
MASEGEDHTEKSTFDTDEFISTIKSFPCIWNYKMESYSNRTVKNNAWATISEMFTPNFEQKSKKEKNNIGK